MSIDIKAQNIAPTLLSYLVATNGPGHSPNYFKRSKLKENNIYKGQKHPQLRVYTTKCLTLSSKVKN